MKRFSQRYGKTLVSELNVTPLIDLAFTLLIIFMITAPLMEQSIDISLPESRPHQPTAITPESIRQVAIDNRGQIFLDRQPVTLGELEIALVDFKNNRPDAAVYLRADSDLRYQQLVHVLDVIKESGVKLGLATVPEGAR